MFTNAIVFATVVALSVTGILTRLTDEAEECIAEQAVTLDLPMEIQDSTFIGQLNKYTFDGIKVTIEPSIEEQGTEFSTFTLIKKVEKQYMFKSENPVNIIGTDNYCYFCFTSKDINGRLNFFFSPEGQEICTLLPDDPSVCDICKNTDSSPNTDVVVKKAKTCTIPTCCDDHLSDQTCTTSEPPIQPTQLEMFCESLFKGMPIEQEEEGAEAKRNVRGSRAKRSFKNKLMALFERKKSKSKSHDSHESDEKTDCGGSSIEQLISLMMKFFAACNQLSLSTTK